MLTEKSVAALRRERAARKLEDLTLDEFVRLMVIETLRRIGRQPKEEQPCESP